MRRSVLVNMDKLAQNEKLERNLAKIHVCDFNFTQNIFLDFSNTCISEYLTVSKSGNVKQQSLVSLWKIKSNLTYYCKRILTQKDSFSQN